jgi:hypothetical protein
LLVEVDRPSLGVQFEQLVPVRHVITVVIQQVKGNQMPEEEDVWTIF